MKNRLRTTIPDPQYLSLDRRLNPTWSTRGHVLHLKMRVAPVRAETAVHNWHQDGSGLVINRLPRSLCKGAV
jgi:hypothetical protein